ncbi:MAG TPA: DUF5668 domain-containing protein [Tissierellaceae bacterium]|nr:DUF5668 domain-containing protein [Tissierellaceae bacterium]
MKNKVIAGVILIVIGVLLLLINLGYLSFDIFFSLFNLWPLILIAIGINIIFKNDRTVSLITWGLFFVIIIIYAIFTQGASDSNIGSSLSFDNIIIEKHPETKYGELDLEIGASKLSFDSTDQDLLTADIRGRQVDYREDHKNNYETAIIDIETRTFRTTKAQNINSEYNFYINEDVIWDMNFNMGAISGELNLEDIPVRNLDLDSGAVDLTFILGNKHDLDFEIDTGASDLSFIFPRDVGLKIKMDIALSDTNINDLALIRKGDYYISQNYDDADVVINLDIDMGIGNIDFSYR